MNPEMIFKINKKLNCILDLDIYLQIVMQYQLKSII